MSLVWMPHMNAPKFGLFAVGLALAASSFAQFDSDKVRLLSNIPLASMPGGASSGSGGSGWVSPGGREYAVMGIRTGAAIYDITTPTAPLLVKFIQGSTTLWHENVVMDGYAYLVSDQTGTGMQVVDMTAADTTHSASLITTYAGNGLSTVHTIQANPQTKTLYLNGSNRGCVFVNVTNPAAPVEVGRWTTKYVHDSVPVNYTTGPWAGKEILFACCGTNGLYILDVTNKAAPTVIGSTLYLPNNFYCHSGTLTPDKRYFLVNDELDENQGSEPDCTTHVVDVQDLANPHEVATFHNPIQIIDHNSNWQDGYLILAAYRGGVRIYDPTNPLAMSQVGYFDTYPGADAFSFDGDWGLYSNYPSGNIILCDINRGFFVVDPSEAKGLGAVPISVSGPSGAINPTVIRKADGIGIALTAGRQSARQSVNISYQTTSKAKTLVDFPVHALLNGGATVMLQLRDRATGFYVTIGSQPIVGGDTTFSNVPLTPYLDSTTGSFDARLTFTPDVTGSASISVDMVRAMVH